MSIFRESDLPLPAQGASIVGKTTKMASRMEGLIDTSAFDVIVFPDFGDFGLIQCHVITRSSSGRVLLSPVKKQKQRHIQVIRVIQVTAKDATHLRANEIIVNEGN